MKKVYKMKSEVWKYPTQFAAWYFINVNKKVSAEIKEKFSKKKRGFGSLPVQVTVGKTSWKTSIFPDKRLGLYVLPIKADVRKKEDIKRGKTITFTIDLKV